MPRKAGKRIGYDTLGQASAGMGMSVKALAELKRRGAAGFRHGHVYPAELEEWLKSNPAEAEAVTARDVPTDSCPRPHPDPKIELQMCQSDKIRLYIKEREGKLVKRARMVECMHLAGGELNTIRVRSEAEHPLLFSAACNGADVAQCRTILRSIWASIFESIGGLSKQFEETDRAGAGDAEGIDEMDTVTGVGSVQKSKPVEAPKKKGVVKRG